MSRWTLWKSAILLGAVLGIGLGYLMRFGPATFRGHAPTSPIVPVVVKLLAGE